MYALLFKNFKLKIFHTIAIAIKQIATKKLNYIPCNLDCFLFNCHLPIIKLKALSLSPLKQLSAIFTLISTLNFANFLKYQKVFDVCLPRLNTARKTKLSCDLK